jgi:hypothetical protein
MGRAIDVLGGCVDGDIGAGGTGAPNDGKPEGNDAIKISVADRRAVLERNLLACILPCRAVAPAMMARRRGRIVNISGVGGRVSGATYRTAKGAVREYTRCLAVETGPLGGSGRGRGDGTLYLAARESSTPHASGLAHYDEALFSFASSVDGWSQVRLRDRRGEEPGRGIGPLAGAFR